MENKSNKILLTVIGAATLLVALVGATFAYFSATSESKDQTITTGSSSITLTAEHNKVANIKPTTFNKTKADADAEANKDLTDDDTLVNTSDVVRIKLNVSSDGNTKGTYDVTMKEPIFSLNADATKTGGAISDIKYALYEENDGEMSLVDGYAVTGNSIKSFTGSTDADNITNTDLLTNVSYDGAFSRTYYLYVWIENKNAKQDKLQDISFNLDFAADATTALE